MFCSSCGNPIKGDAKFCVRCGAQVSLSNELNSSKLSVSSETTCSKSSTKVPSLNSFMEKKKEERKSHFKVNKKGKNSKRNDEEATVNIGIMKINGEGQLKQVRGKCLAITVRKSANSEEILNSAVTKHSLHNSNDVINSPVSYKLLYPDGTKVESLKESEEPFVLQKYKNEINKSYQRIKFYICSNSDFLQNTVNGMLNSESSESSDDDVQLVPKKICLPKQSTVATATSNVSNPSTLPSTSNTTNLDHVTPHSQVKEIFPHLSDLAILNALKECGSAENAITTLSEKTFASKDQIDAYASMIDNDDEWKYDESIEIASNTSENESEETEKVPLRNVDQLLTELKDKCFNSGEQIKLKIRRNFVWEDTVLKLKRFQKEKLATGVVNVQFVGEPTVDEGGPRKELFFLIHRHMQTSCLFTGEKNCRSFAHNVLALQKEEYYYYGVISALSILQGSPGPIMFSPPVVDYIMHGKLDAVSTSISDLPQGKVRDKLEELDSITDPDIFKQEASFNSQFRFKAGYSKPMVNLESKEEFFKCICLHFTILNSLPEIEQFIVGLNINGVLEVIRRSPKASRKLLQQSEAAQLTADIVDELFHFSYSPMGSNKRNEEEAIAFNFTHYLEDVEANLVSTDFLDPATDELNTINVQLSHILQFVTGCPSIPATGFDDQRNVIFDHDETKRKLTANTCSCTLHLPVSKVLVEYTSFKEEFTSCIFGSPGFGQV